MTTPAKMVDSAEPTVTFGTPAKDSGDIEVTVMNGTAPYAKGSKITLPGIDKEYEVGDNGKITVPNSELPNSATAGAPKATETGKLPKAGSSVTTPAKLTSSKGESSIQKDLSELKEITTEWKDEQGNVLKQAITKSPEEMSKDLSAFEHGEIEGYVFVKTKVEGDVVTHVFRKVSPVRPTGDGQQRLATPSADTNRRPDTATPAEVPATQPAEQPSQTVEVPAQLPNEVSETDSSVSQPQAVLPNTGTKADRATGALGVLSLLGAFGLLFAKKKKDDEEEA